MSISWFCLWDAPADRGTGLDPFDRGAMTALVKGCPGVDSGFLMVPADGHDPYFPDSRNPSVLLLQLEFADITALETAIGARGPLEPLADAALWPSLAGCTISHQAMATRRYAVPDPVIRTEDGASLSYMVEYQGPADDVNAWHVAYVARHPLLLAKFPGIRAIEIYTPVTVIHGLPFRDRAAMQRNKTVFDTPAAMNAAMATPARDELRADALRLPPFTGAKDHFPFRAAPIHDGPQ